MRRLRAWIVRLRDTALRRRYLHEITEELESHLQLHVDENLRAGMTPAEARRDAQLKLGGALTVRDDLRDRHGIPLLAMLAQDLRSSARMVRRAPAPALAVILTLAIGVGATTAIFSLADALMFRPPDLVRDPSALVSVSAPNYVAFQDLAARARSLDLAAYTRQTLSLGAGVDAVTVRAECVTGGYLPILGVSPALGRGFRREEVARGGPPAVILSHDLWTNRFNGAPSIVGRSITLTGKVFTVIGVAPPRFHGIAVEPIDVWIALAVSPEACSFTGTNLLASSRGAWLSTLGRIRSGSTLDQARAELATLQAPAGESLGSGRLEPLLATTRASGRDGRIAIWLTAGAVVVLLLACANVAGLLSIRALDRHREIVVRLQLGASRPRVFAQLILEHLVLVVLGTSGACLVASGLWPLIVSYFPEAAVASLLSTRSMVLMGAFAALAAALSCLPPSLQASRAELGLFRSGRTLSHSRSGFRRNLVIVQVAFALVLVAGAGVFARSVQNVKRNTGTTPTAWSSPRSTWRVRGSIAQPTCAPRFRFCWIACATFPASNRQV